MGLQGLKRRFFWALNVAAEAATFKALIHVDLVPRSTWNQSSKALIHIEAVEQWTHST
jgi:hypothetical protein